jgi:hypothetical protein
MYKLKLHKHLAERWQDFSLRQQILMIVNELQRAGNWIKKQDKEEAARAYERAFELVDMTVECAGRRTLIKELLRWRELLAAEYSSDEYKEKENDKLLTVLITLSPDAYRVFHNI